MVPHSLALQLHLGLAFLQRCSRELKPGVATMGVSFRST